MAAYLLLSTGPDLTLGDVELWVKRARALGAQADTPIHLDEPSKATDTPQLSIPVNVTRTVLPEASA